MSITDDSNEAFYWSGLLASDGCFHPDQNGEIKYVTIDFSSKDSTHIDKLGSFLGSSSHSYCLSSDNTYYRVRTGIWDRNVAHELSKKFDLRPRKTYNPPNPNLDWMNDEQFLSFLVGFIDGDGSIDKGRATCNASIRIKLHRNWQPNLEYMDSRLSRIVGKKPYGTQITKAGYVKVNWGDLKTVQFLKTFAVGNNLPVLARKWDNIDLSIKLKIKRVNTYET